MRPNQISELIAALVGFGLLAMPLLYIRSLLAAQPNLAPQKAVREIETTSDLRNEYSNNAQGVLLILILAGLGVFDQLGEDYFQAASPEQVKAWFILLTLIFLSALRFHLTRPRKSLYYFLFDQIEYTDERFVQNANQARSNAVRATFIIGLISALFLEIRDVSISAFAVVLSLSFLHELVYSHQLYVLEKRDDIFP